jgi:hypothetical protein
MSAMQPEALIAALGQLAAALEQSDPVASGAAASGLAPILESLERAESRWPAAQLATAQALYERCQDNAARVVANLRASLLQSSLHRRAADSYAAGGHAEAASGKGLP